MKKIFAIVIVAALALSLCIGASANRIISLTESNGFRFRSLLVPAPKR